MSELGLEELCLLCRLRQHVHAHSILHLMQHAAGLRDGSDDEQAPRVHAKHVGEDADQRVEGVLIADTRGAVEHEHHPHLGPAGWAHRASTVNPPLLLVLVVDSV